MWWGRSCSSFAGRHHHSFPVHVVGRNYGKSSSGGRPDQGQLLRHAVTELRGCLPPFADPTVRPAAQRLFPLFPRPVGQSTAAAASPAVSSGGTGAKMHRTGPATTAVSRTWLYNIGLAAVQPGCQSSPFARNTETMPAAPRCWTGQQYQRQHSQHYRSPSHAPYVGSRSHHHHHSGAHCQLAGLSGFGIWMLPQQHL